MRKTLLTRLLCMLLIALLPIAALAEVTAPAEPLVANDDLNLMTISLTPGEEMAQLQAVADLCNALSIELYSSQSEAVGLSILLDRQSVFSANIRADDEGIYVDSKEIYDKPLYFSQADLQNFLTEMMKSSGADAAAIAQFEQNFSLGMMSAMNAAQNTDDIPATDDLSDPEVRQAIIDAMGGDDSYLKFVEDLMTRAVDTAGEFTSADHDPATQKKELLITQADIVALMDTTYIREQIKNQLSTEYPAPTGAELDKITDETIQEAKDELAEMDILIPVTALYSEDDLVSLSIPVTFKGKDEQSIVDVSMAIDYRRLTTDGNVNYHFQMAVKADDPETMLVDAVVNKYENGNYDLDFIVKANDETYFSAKGIYEISGDQTTALLSLLPEDSEEVIFELTRAKTETGADNHLSFYMRSGGAGQMVLTAADKPLFTLNVSTAVVADDGRFDAVNAATPATATQMLQLGAEERNTFEATVLATVQQAAMNALAKLPASAMTLIMGEPADMAAPTVNAD